MEKERVLITGASGSMGFEAFKLLWEKRDRYEIALLLRPSKKNRKLFSSYEKLAGTDRGTGVDHRSGRGVSEGQGMKIVWGDGLDPEDVAEAVRGIRWCFHCMALISPAADRNPDLAWKVNHEGTQRLVEAIEAEDPDNIRIVNIASVALYGDRLPPVHVGRTGDPVIPSVYDHYALTKIAAELEVMQSRISHRVSLRQTFIMIPDLFSLKDPIMFHQPLNSFMENVTARDSGRMLVAILDVPVDSDFWGGYYNISGGPSCRTTFMEFLERIYSMLGLRIHKTMDRNWFALKNFHMMFFGDSARLNDYLKHWDGAQSMEEFYREVRKSFPRYLKATAWFCKYLPPFRWLVEKVTRGELKKLAVMEEGTLHWIRHGEEGKIRAFYGSPEAYHAIPGWKDPLPSLDHHQEYRILDHGYEEQKAKLERKDLDAAASFRGGSLESEKWSGNLHEKLDWKCGQGHAFAMTPHAILKGGHWCEKCISEPWDYSNIAAINPFACQLINPA